MSKKVPAGLEALTRERGLFPQESLLKVKEGRKSLKIGIPKEVYLQERRLGLTPESIALLVNNGHEISVEAGAGLPSKIADKEYSEAGAKIVYSAKEVYESEIILKIEPPTYDEIEFMKPGQHLFSALQLGNLSPEYIHALNKKKVTAIAFELIEDKVGGMPAVRAMSEIVGNTSIMIAAELLSSSNNGKGIILGGITGVRPTKVVILGAGTVAEYAARAALGMGAQIQIFDNHLYKLRRIKHALENQVYTSTIDAYNLGQSLTTTDVLIGALRADKGKTRIVVTEEMVSRMKPDSVIIDVSIDQGGCIETSELSTHDNPTYRLHDVIHYCVPNIASRVPRTATTAFSNIFTPIILQIAEAGGIDDMIFMYKWFLKGVYTYKGSLTNAHIGEKLGLKHKDLNLFAAARF